MLEERINVLIQSIDVLTAVINRFWDQKEDIKGIKPPPISAEPPKAKDEPKEEPKPEPKEEPKPEPKVGTVTREELHKLCLAIVRDKPNAKTKIQKVLSKRLVKDLKDDELETIKIALEKI